LEDIVSEIGMMCIRQVIVGVHVGTATKGFACLAALLLCMIATNFVTSPPLHLALSLLPVFFAVMAAFILVEIAWYLHREGEELLEFVARDDENEVQPNSSVKADVPQERHAG